VTAFCHVIQWRTTQLCCTKSSSLLRPYQEHQEHRTRLHSFTTPDVYTYALLLLCRCVGGGSCRLLREARVRSR
jgi:hypothetical protein